MMLLIKTEEQIMQMLRTIEESSVQDILKGYEENNNSDKKASAQ